MGCVCNSDLMTSGTDTNCQNLSSCPPRPSSFLDTRNYLKRRLGYPVICVEISDDQLDQIIIDVAGLAQRYLYGEGNRRDYCVFGIEKDKITYELPCDIIDTVDFNFMGYLDGINVLFSPTNMLLHNEWVNQGNYPGSGSSGGSLVSYDIAMMYFKEVQNQLSTSYQVDYHDPSRTLYISPTPKEDGVGVLEVWRKTEVKDLLDHVIVKELMYGRALKQWGMHLSKYSLNMPGGAQVQGENLWSRGEEIENTWMEKLIGESYYPQFFVG